MGWRGNSKAFSAHPAMGTLARAEMEMMAEGLSRYEWALLLWGVRQFHRAVLEITEARIPDGA